MLTLSLTKAIIGAYGYSARGNNSRPHSLAAVDDYRRHIIAEKKLLGTGSQKSGSERVKHKWLPVS